MEGEIVDGAKFAIEFRRNGDGEGDFQILDHLDVGHGVAAKLDIPNRVIGDLVVWKEEGFGEDLLDGFDGFLNLFAIESFEGDDGFLSLDEVDEVLWVLGEILLDREALGLHGVGDRDGLLVDIELRDFLATWDLVVDRIKLLFDLWEFLTGNFVAKFGDEDDFLVHATAISEDTDMFDACDFLEVGLDFIREDVFAVGADDGVFQTALDVDAAVFFDFSDIASGHEAVFVFGFFTDAADDFLAVEEFALDHEFALLLTFLIFLELIFDAI